MTRFLTRTRRLAAAIATILAFAATMPAAPARAELAIDPPRALDDGTTVGGFRLSNGLRVVTRHVPQAGAVAITVAYGFGFDLDPAGREGLSLLLGRSYFMGDAGDVPERTSKDLDSARPLGWTVEVTRRVTRLTEVASKQQFAGALHQTAQRMQGVTISPKIVAAATKETRDQLASNYYSDPGVALYYQVREVAAPGGHEHALRYAASKGIEKVTAAELTKLAKERFVPANAVLSLSGELELTGAALGRVLENEFGTIPAGAPLPTTPPAALRDTFVVVHRPGIEYSLGTIGIIAPALSDSTHPAFYLHSLIMGSSFSARWPRNPVTPSRFQYSLFDDPDLARVYPIVTISDYEVGRMREEYLEAMQEVTRSNLRPEQFRQIQSGVRWLLGGPLNSEIKKRITTDRGLLLVLNTSAATRELWGGEAFWADYRRRYDAIDRPSLNDWAGYYADPGNQVQLLYDPKYDRSVAR